MAVVGDGVDHLRRSLLDAWARATAASLAHEFPRELTDWLVSVLPESAPEILALVRHGRYEELYLLEHHAPLLWRLARTTFVERITAVQGMVRAVPTLARLADTVAVAERAEVHALAASLFPAVDDPDERAEALFAWSRHEPPERANAMITEGLAMMGAAAPSTSSRLILQFPPAFAARVPEVRALVEPHLAGEHAADILAARARLGSAAERRADVERTLALRTDARKLGFGLCVLIEHVPFEWLDAAVVRCIDQLASRRDRVFFSKRLAPRAPERVLDHILDRARAARMEPWALAEIIASVAPHHPRQGDALRAELEGILGAVLESTASALEFPVGVDDRLFRVQIAADTAGALRDPARRRMQQRALRILESSATHDRRAVDRIDWAALGRGLDPGLRTEAVRVVSAMQSRPSALAAIGRMVDEFPPEHRHLGLAVLSRLGERGPDDGLAEVVAALRSPDPAARPAASEPHAQAEAVAAALARWGEDYLATIEPALVQQVRALAAPGDALWSGRLAAALDRKRLDGAQCLAVLGGLAPVVAHLCGAAFASALADRISAPLPVPRFARPWAGAGTRVAEA